MFFSSKNSQKKKKEKEISNKNSKIQEKAKEEIEDKYIQFHKNKINLKHEKMFAFANKLKEYLK